MFALAKRIQIQGGSPADLTCVRKPLFQRTTYYFVHPGCTIGVLLTRVRILIYSLIRGPLTLRRISVCNQVAQLGASAQWYSSFLRQSIQGAFVVKSDFRAVSRKPTGIPSLAEPSGSE